MRIWWWRMKWMAMSNQRSLFTWQAVGLGVSKVLRLCSFVFYFQLFSFISAAFFNFCMGQKRNFWKELKRKESSGEVSVKFMQEIASAGHFLIGSCEELSLRIQSHFCVGCSWPKLCCSMSCERLLSSVLIFDVTSSQADSQSLVNAFVLGVCRMHFSFRSTGCEIQVWRSHL